MALDWLTEDAAASVEFKTARYTSVIFGGGGQLKITVCIEPGVDQYGLTADLAILDVFLIPDTGVNKDLQ